jgi:hypothetical protein
VIFGEQKTMYLKLKNAGALATRIYVKTNDGRSIPFFGMDDLRQRDEEARILRERQEMKKANILQAQKDAEDAKEQLNKAGSIQNEEA